MHLLLLPDDIIFYITHFLSLIDKISARETSIEFYNNIKFMQIKILFMNNIFDTIINGKIYMLNRLRLANLCGLQNHTVSEIWSWISLTSDIKHDALKILRQIDTAIY